MILILRHTPENSLGHLEPVLDELGLPFRYIETYEKRYSDLDVLRREFSESQPDNRQQAISGLIILGGPQNVDETGKFPHLKSELTVIREWVTEDMPTFGICLGAQLIARSLGEIVHQKLHTEIGWTPIFLTEAGKADPVLSQLADGTAQIQWHNDSFNLPYGATWLAYSQKAPHQAFKLGKHVYAVQFHPEVNLDTLDLWFGKPSNSASEVERHCVLAETQAMYNARKTVSQELFRTFCQLHFTPLV